MLKNKTTTSRDKSVPTTNLWNTANVSKTSKIQLEQSAIKCCRMFPRVIIDHNFKMCTVLTRKLNMNTLLIPKRSIKHDLQLRQDSPHFNHPFPVVRSVHPYPLAHEKGEGGLPGCSFTSLKPKFKKHGFCKYYDIERFTSLNLQPKSATEIDWWLVNWNFER
jgi:hypothetical protein